MADNRGHENSIPQLIMPSLTVPRRRPFSEVGKSLGKLKIMVSGRNGMTSHESSHVRMRLTIFQVLVKPHSSRPWHNIASTSSTWTQ